MKSTVSRLTLTILFLALLFVPGIVWLIAGDKLAAPSLENRTLAEWPEFSWKKIDTLPAKYEDYFQDHLPFRSQLISNYARLLKEACDDCVVTTVGFGKESWFFYKNVNDGDPIANYRGEDLFTSEELRRIVVDLRRTRDNLKKQGIEFVLFIAPNKERVYPEYMPDRYGQPAEEYATRQLVDFLRAHTDLRVVYAYDEIMEAKEALGGLPLYFSSDTHWNALGSYVGARALLRELGIETPALAPENITQVQTGIKGDLSIMAHLYDFIRGDPQYSIRDDSRPAFSNTSDPLQMVNSATGVATGPRVFIRHDSFLAAMRDYLFPWFSETSTYFNHLYKDEQVDEFQPDVFIQVLVERNMRAQLTEGPLYTPPAAR